MPIQHAIMCPISALMCYQQMPPQPLYHVTYAINDQSKKLWAQNSLEWKVSEASEVPNL